VLHESVKVGGIRRSFRLSGGLFGNEFLDANIELRFRLSEKLAVPAVQNKGVQMPLECLFRKLTTKFGVAPLSGVKLFYLLIPCDFVWFQSCERYLDQEIGELSLPDLLSLRTGEGAFF
jgi:hypothetical protein